MLEARGGSTCSKCSQSARFENVEGVSWHTIFKHSENSLLPPSKGPGTVGHPMRPENQQTYFGPGPNFGSIATALRDMTGSSVR